VRLDAITESRAAFVEQIPGVKSDDSYARNNQQNQDGNLKNQFVGAFLFHVFPFVFCFDYNVNVAKEKHGGCVSIQNPFAPPFKVRPVDIVA
jgi:hypothetical protein